MQTSRLAVVGARDVADRTTLLPVPDEAATRKQSVAYWHKMALGQADELRRLHAMISSIQESAQGVRAALSEALSVSNHILPPDRAIAAIVAMRPETPISFRVQARHVQQLLNLV